MRWRVIAWISLGVNILLAVACLWVSRQAGRAPVTPPATETVAGPGKTNVVIRRQFFTWHEVESSDYPTYIANLRDIGCPEQTIRDIIIADVNALYSKKLGAEVVTPSQQWWRSEPDASVVHAAMEKARSLEDERRALLTRLLGLNWESGDMVNLPRPSRPGIQLDGPLLGAMTAEAKQGVQDINNRYQERVQELLAVAARAGQEADPAAIARLRAQTREELSKVLTPAQLEEFMLRYSHSADTWRTQFGQLRFFNPSQEEFRAVFRATDLVDQQIALLGDATDPNSVQARKTLEDQREAAVKTALGPRRYSEYRMLQDPLYREAVAAAQEAGTPEAARMIYNIKLAAAAEQASINDDSTLTDSQKSIQLKQLEADQLRANSVATGRSLPPEPPAPTPPPRTYTLGPGDSAAVVSLIYGVPVSALRAANPGLDLNRLKPGDRLTIPRGALGPGVPPP